MNPAAVLEIIVNAQTGQATAALGKLDAQMAGTAATTGKSTGKMAAAAKYGMAAIGAAAVGAAVELYKIGDTFDSASDSIRKDTGKSGKALRGLQKDFKAVYATVPSSAGDTATAIGEISARLNETGKPLRMTARNMLTLSRLTGTDLQGNIKEVTRLYMDWGVAQKDQVPTLNKLWRAHQKTGVTISDLANNMVKFGSPLRQLGFDFDTATAMFSAFEQQGVNMQTLMPGLRMALKNFAAPTADLAKSFKELGVNTDKPAQGLQTVFDHIKAMPSTTKAAGYAMQVFGTRAGPDMAAAVREGRLNLDDLIKTISGGKGTIAGTAKQTDDFSEKWTTFGHKMSVLVAPIAKKVFDGINAALSELIKFNPQKFLHSLGVTGNDLKALGQVFKVFGQVLKVVLIDTAKKAIAGFVQGLRGAIGIVRNIVNLIGDVLHGRFGDIWRDVKGIFSSGVALIVGTLKTASAPIRVAAGAIGDALSGVFGGVWKRVKAIFVGGANAVISVVNKIIDVINVVPGVPDIGSIGKLGGGAGENTVIPNHGHGVTHGHARGGPIYGGLPNGDSIPAMLERGEYVLNRKAVAQVGRGKLDQLNFKHAARFQQGGAVQGYDIGGIASSVGGTLAGVGSSVLGAGQSVLNKGADFFLSKLPTPNLPAWMGNLGGYLIDHVTDYIKNGFQDKKFGKFSTAGGVNYMPGGGGPVIAQIGRILLANGLSKKGAAGIIGNALQESGYNPASVGSGGGGLWGFTSSPNSLADLQAFAVAQNKPWTDVGLQTQFMLNHVPASTISHLNAAGSAGDAAAIFMNEWERPYAPTANLARRQAGARQALAMGYQAGGAVTDAARQNGNPYNARAMRGTPTAAPRKGTGGFLPKTLDRIKAKADLISNAFTGYVWGGGHGEGTNVTSNGLDCSGAVAKLMQQSGWTDFAVDFSSNYLDNFMSGPGDQFTIWANDSHTFAEIDGKEWGTYSNSLGYNTHTHAGFGATHPALNPGTGSAVTKGLAGLSGNGAPKAPATMSGLLPNVNFGALPTTLAGVTAEIEQCRANLRLINEALKTVTGDEAKPYKATAARIKARITLLLAQRASIILRRQAKFRQRLTNTGLLPGFEAKINAFEGDEGKINIASAAAGKLVSLEPETFDSQNAFDLYKGLETAGYGKVLGDQFSERNLVANGIIAAREKIKGIMPYVHALAGLVKRPGSKADKAVRKQNLAAAQAAVTGLGNLSGTYLADLSRLDGPGQTHQPLTKLPDYYGTGEIFDTQLTMRGLGLDKFSPEGGGANTMDISGLRALLEAARYGIFNYSALTASGGGLDSYAGAFAKGGKIGAGMWGIAGEAGPEIVHGPATVIPGAGAKVNVTNNVYMDGMDMVIDTFINGALDKRERQNFMTAKAGKR